MTLFDNEPATREYLAELFAELPDVLIYLQNTQISFEPVWLYSYVASWSFKTALHDILVCLKSFGFHP